MLGFLYGDRLGDSIMTKELEYSKKIAVLRKLVRLNLISETEYILIKNKIIDSNNRESRPLVCIIK